MSPIAPANRKLSDTIKTLMEERYNLMSERVLYLDRERVVQVDLQLDGAKPGEIGAIRDELLAKKSLGAIVHFSIMLNRIARFTVVEAFDDPEHPTFHALTSIYGEGGEANHRWVPANPHVIDRWTAVWDGREEQEDS